MFFNSRRIFQLERQVEELTEAIKLLLIDGIVESQPKKKKRKYTKSGKYSKKSQEERKPLKESVYRIKK